MNHLYVLIISQKNTLIKGWFISTLIVLPFTFIPTWIEFGFSLEETLYRVSHSILYSLGFSLFVVIVSVVHNYNNLLFRKKIFDKAAFTELDFHGVINGDESIIDELETSLLGKVGNYYFLINLIEPESEKCIIQIVPYIKTEDNKELVDILKTNFGFKQIWLLGKEIELNEQQLDDKFSIKKILKEMEIDLKTLQAEPTIPNSF
tara:strand:- start:345 stop:959 length:615 start_codon:yes stop_codon:yes gene_type:complete